MNNNNLIDILLKKLPNASLSSANTEITCRCVYCGGSKHDKSKKSMYVSIPQNEDDVMLYNCFRATCGAKGIVTEQTLIDWGIYDDKALLEISKHNKVALGKAKNRRYKVNNSYIYNIKNSKITDNKFSRYKLKYINNRLGTNFTYTDILNFKIVLNLYDVLSENGINELTMNKYMTDKLNNEYIGFLNIDNGLLNCRSVNPKSAINMRYINYNLFNNSTSKRFYVMPGSVNNKDIVNVHIAEGVFDILSIYENLNRKSVPNSLFACIFGASYYSIMKWFILDANLRHIHFHVYVDTDALDTRLIFKLKELASKTRSELTIHSNQFPGEKDFGVTKDRIQDAIMHI